MELQDIWSLIVYNFVGCLLVFTRVTGIFTFNPIFARANVPNRIKIALSLVLSVLMLASMGGNTGFVYGSVFDFAGAIIKELLIGLILGFMVNLILTVFIYAGEMIDNQVGLGMAKAMDPSTGVTMPIFANIYYYLFILYFFLTGGHLSYIKLFSMSYEAIPIGYELGVTAINIPYVIVSYLTTVLTLAVKFAMPVVATELIVEFCIGVLMKAVPTIQVFMVNIQLKVLIGLFVLIILAAPMSDFIEELLNILWANLYGLKDMMTV